MMFKLCYLWLVIPVYEAAVPFRDLTSSCKYVCTGNSVEVFQNVTSTFLKSDYTLYKIFGKTTETIAMWVMQNFSTKAIIHQNYTHKVSLENGTVLLQNFQASDEATYTLLYQDSSKKKEVQLCASVPPTLLCKLSITREEQVLIASLTNLEYCGQPLVNVRWMENSGCIYGAKLKIVLHPGYEAVTCRACIEGEALNCVKDSSLQDNCENYTIRSRERAIAQSTTMPSTVSKISDEPQWKTDRIVIAAIVTGALLSVVLILIRLLRNLRRVNKNVSSVYIKLTEAPSTMTEDFSAQYNADQEYGNQGTVPTIRAIDKETQTMLR